MLKPRHLLAGIALAIILLVWWAQGRDRASSPTQESATVSAPEAVRDTKSDSTTQLSAHDSEPMAQAHGSELLSQCLAAHGTLRLDHGASLQEMIRQYVSADARVETHWRNEHYRSANGEVLRLNFIAPDEKPTKVKVYREDEEGYPILADEYKDYEKGIQDSDLAHLRSFGQRTLHEEKRAVSSQQTTIEYIERNGQIEQADFWLTNGYLNCQKNSETNVLICDCGRGRK